MKKDIPIQLLVILIVIWMSLQTCNSCHAANDYDIYNPVYLGWAKPLKIIEAKTIDFDGLYHIVFQTQAVNDTNSVTNGYGMTIMVTAKLMINDEVIKGWTENIPCDRHYSCPIIVKILYLHKGDVVTIQMRGDCSQKYPSRSVFILTREDRHQFDVDPL